MWEQLRRYHHQNLLIRLVLEMLLLVLFFMVGVTGDRDCVCTLRLLCLNVGLPRIIVLHNIPVVDYMLVLDSR